MNSGTQASLEDLRYPVGRFQYDGDAGSEARARRIREIAAAPEHLRQAVAGLTAKQLDTPYRPGGWTVRQVVHHVPDSHLNAYIRIKLALTEDEPTIKPYEEARWAELPDARSAPVDVSLTLLDVLHQRWVLLLQQLGPAEMRRSFIHPEHGRRLELDEVIAMYAWHGRHHAAHITSLRERLGWG